MLPELTKTPRVYLGDEVYAEHDGFHFVLMTTDGIADTNTVYLGPQVMQNFLDFADKIKDRQLRLNLLAQSIDSYYGQDPQYDKKDQYCQGTLLKLNGANCYHDLQANKENSNV